MNIFLNLLSILSNSAFYISLSLIALIVLCNPYHNPLDRFYSLLWEKEDYSSVFDMNKMSEEDKKTFLLTQINTKLNTDVSDKSMFYYNKSKIRLTHQCIRIFMDHLISILTV
jgi:hypothetical protein